MTSSPTSATARTALKNAMLPPAVTTTRWAESIGIPFSARSLSARAARSADVPSTAPYWWVLGSSVTPWMASMACWGGPYATMPWPREMVPGLERTRSPTIGMIGVWTSSMRRDCRMGGQSTEVSSFLRRRNDDISFVPLEQAHLDGFVLGHQGLKLLDVAHLLAAVVVGVHDLGLEGQDRVGRVVDVHRVRQVHA